MGNHALACWIAAPLPGLVALWCTACLAPSSHPPLPGEDAAFDLDSGVVADTAPAVDSAPPPDAGPLPCATNNGGCDPHATCTNGDAAAICTCNAGYAGDGLTCASDCLTGNGGCDPNATCANGDGGVVCTCNAGYVGSGVTCASDCATANGGCDLNATCSNGDAGVVCTCDPGYLGSGVTCASACLTNNGGCDPNATCSNGVAGVLCACNAGFSGTGTTCFSNDYTNWPAPSDGPPETEYTVSADGTIVTDGVTGLVWQRQVFADACPSDDDAGLGGCTWPDAQTYCASLNGLALGGISSGWRLPSIVELISIVNYNDGSPAIDTSDFPATPAVPFWAHTPNAADSSQAWSVSFATGLNTTQATTLGSAVRCVTSVHPTASTPSCGTVGLACCYAQSCGPDLACYGSTCAVASDYEQSFVPADAPLESSSMVSADGAIVTDAVTGLHWQRALDADPCPSDADAGTSGGGCTWPDAQTYCASLDGLTIGGISAGWRVPSVVELLSIVNYSAGSPALDTALFPSTPPVVFWAQTPNASSGAQAWSVSFSTGLNAPQATTTVSPVRCVSSVAPSLSPPTCGVSGDACCHANACGPDLACNSAVCNVDSNYTQSAVAADSPPEPGYTVSPGGSVVTDGVTGLVWQREVLANPCPNDDAGTGSPGCRWTDAAAYCASMNSLVLGGYASGWRLPSVVELLSIANYAATPLIDPSPFSNPPPATFWSGTPNPSAAAQAWSVSYATGENTSQPTSTLFEVRCVNAGGVTPAPEGCGSAGKACCYASTCAAPLLCSGSTCVTDTNYALWKLAPDAPPAGLDGGANEYTVAGGVATDTVTGLVWATNSGGGMQTWGNASAFCASFNTASLGGFSSGWRLPSLVELLSLVNYSVTSGPMIDTSVFTAATTSPYWTSTLGAGTTTQAWSVSLSNGFTSQSATSTAMGLFCVNSG
ncbi:MAG: DUF1566 domain-containing protein [Polyangiaceae bacterium]